jgi:hypothetical protein
MSVYLGYYRTVPEFRLDDRFRRLVVDLPDKIPAGCLLVGSFAPAGGAAGIGASRPAVMIIETDHEEDLEFISRYYADYLVFDWVSVRPIGTSRQERESWAATVAEAAEDQAAGAVSAEIYGPATVSL